MPINKSRRDIENSVKIQKNMTILAISVTSFEIDFSTVIIKYLTKWQMRLTGTIVSFQITNNVFELKNDLFMLK